MNWSKSLKGKVRFKEPLSRHTSFKIGGSASLLIEPKDLDDLTNCLSNLKKDKIPYFIIGNGTNLLINDKGFRGAVIKLDLPYFRNIKIKDNIVSVGAGVSLPVLLKFLNEEKFIGLEFLAGIPGSVGGALVMNAGVTINKKRISIGDVVSKIMVLDKNGKKVLLNKKDAKFKYRGSNLDRYIVLGAQLKLLKDKTKLNNRVKDYVSHRKDRVDYSKPNAGCVFKNPSLYLSAGALIDRCGLKGKRIGGAMVSNKHANFILNFNRATAKDVIQLVKFIKNRVRNKFGINLKEEIRIV